MVDTTVRIGKLAAVDTTVRRGGLAAVDTTASDGEKKKERRARDN